MLRDGSVQCWGYDGSGEATPPDGEFASVSAGESHTCGVLRDGSVIFWGSDGSGQATPPEGELASVNAGGGYTCGVLAMVRSYAGAVTALARSRRLRGSSPPSAPGATTPAE